MEQRPQKDNIIINLIITFKNNFDLMAILNEKIELNEEEIQIQESSRENDIMTVLGKLTNFTNEQ
ncbi:hypothetical protein BpHYR1_025567 [Brachionus plicatilis]|uniref:Uncharacterized protein n=1 Tax=Brachionus plicatilis TaxID=10195 RepID=A0A3M7Q439_BRAPC|nr:hypothetical protein BpHYR1_025567 [Brachionus plicatilis]